MTKMLYAAGKPVCTLPDCATDFAPAVTLNSVCLYAIACLTYENEDYTAI